MLGSLQRLPLRIQRVLGRLVGLLCGLNLRGSRLHDLLMAGQAGLCRRQAGALALLLARDLVQFQLDLPAALQEPLQPLGQPEAFHLLFMHLLFQGRSFLPQRRQALVMAAERGLDHMLISARLAQRLFALTQLDTQIFYFALPREYAGVPRVRRMEADRAARKLVSLATDQDHAGRQRVPVRGVGWRSPPHTPRAANPALHRARPRRESRAGRQEAACLRAPLSGTAAVAA